MKESGFIESFDGTKIYWQGWLTKAEPRALVFISHGLGEHIGRYEHLAQFLVERGFSVFGSDHRGHGKSGGKRGHIKSFDEYLRDYKIFRDQTLERHSAPRLFLIGHSMGGLIAVHYLLTYPEDFSALILSSPALKVKIDASPIKLALGRFFSRALPGITMSNGLDPNLVSRDPEVVKKYIEDPLVHDRVSARWFTCFVSAIDQAQARAGELNLPILIMQSGADGLVVPEGAREFYQKVSSPDKTLKIWEGFYHEMFNEPEKQEVFEFLFHWMEKHL